MACVENYEFFFRIQSPFSQWHPAKFCLDGMEFNCAEQYYMYKKAMYFCDHNTAEKIMCTSNPNKQKSLGRQVRHFDANTWKNVCQQVVREGNHAKVSVKSNISDIFYFTFLLFYSPHFQF